MTATKRQDAGSTLGPQGSQEQPETLDPNRPIREDSEAYTAFRRAFWARWYAAMGKPETSDDKDRQEMARWGCLQSWWGVRHLGDVPHRSAVATTGRLRRMSVADFRKAIREAL